MSRENLLHGIFSFQSDIYSFGVLIYEIVERWSGTDPKTMGASYAQIVSHVADYSNIERVEATELVNQVLSTMTILERSVGDHFRIKPFLFKALEEKYRSKPPC